MTDKPDSDAAIAVQRLLEIMARLRDPQGGCAWDRKQTLESLTSHTLEEVYEVIDAVEQKDPGQLQDELGDLLFQIVFYAQIAAEAQLFDFAAVAQGISNKLLRRHPHIFPSGEVESFGSSASADINAEQVEANWEVIKEQERAERGEQSRNAERSVLDDVPLAFPALDRAKKLQKRAASIGFDWQEVEPVLAKLQEETAELQQAISEGEQSAIMHEMGDLLFCCVNIARHLRVEPESALRAANQRFERRFRFVEKAASDSPAGLQNVSLETLESLWQQAKAKGL